MKELKKQVKRSSKKLVMASLAATMAFGAMVPMSTMGAFAHEPEVEKVEMGESGKESVPESTNTQLDSDANTEKVEDKKESENSEKAEDKKESENSEKAEDKKESENSEGTEDKKEEDTETKENQNEEDNSDKVNDLDDLWKKLEEKEKEKKAEAEKANQDKKAKEEEKKTEKTINTAGGIAGDIIVKLVKNDYESSGDALKDVLKTTVTGLNEAFLKNLPYVGGLVNSLIKGFMSSEKAQGPSEVEKGFTTMHGDLRDINESIIKGTNLILDNTNDSQINVKVKDINDAAKLLQEFYSKHNSDFTTTMVHINKNGENSAVDEIEKTMKGIYSKENSDFFTAYKDYVNLITNHSDQIATFTKFGGNSDLFALADHIVTQNKTSATPMVEYQAARESFTNKIKAFCDTGYDVLNVSIRAELSKFEGMYVVAKKQLNRYTELAQNETDPAKKQIYMDKKEEFSNMVLSAEKGYNHTKNDLAELNELQKKFNTSCSNQLTNIGNQKNAFDEKLKNNPLPTYIKVGTLEVRSEQMKDGTKLYPYNNEKEHIIEYKDQYGNIKATRSYKDEKVGQYQVKVGEVYLIKNGFGRRYNLSDLKHGYDKISCLNPILISDVKEVHNTFFTTVRTIVGFDLVRQSNVMVEIGCDELKNNIYHTVTGDLEFK